jgi:hypothetical protein
MASRTIDVERNELDKSIAVLSSAAQALKLTRFERLFVKVFLEGSQTQKTRSQFSLQIVVD